MTHEQAILELSSLIDGALPAAQKQAVEGHLAGCEECRERFEELKGALALFKAHGRSQAPAAFKTRVLAQAAGQQAPAVDPFRYWKPALGAAFATAAVVFVFTSALKKTMPGMFDQTQGMISGAAGQMGENAQGFSAPAAQAPRGEDNTPSFGNVLRQQAAAPRAFSKASQRPAQAVALDGLSGAGAGVSYEAARSRVHAAAAPRGEARPIPQEAPGPKASVVEYEDAASFGQFWRTTTVAPKPSVDFSASRVVVLGNHPPGNTWAIVELIETPEKEVLLYKEFPVPPAPEGMAQQPLPPAFRILPIGHKPLRIVKVQ